MIKFETLGMIDRAKINPVLTAENDVENYSFLEKDGITYLVLNHGTGDDAFRTDIVIPAGEYMRGFDLAAHINQKLVIDLIHTDYDLEAATPVAPAKNDILTISDGKLAKAEEAPESGLYLKVTDTGCKLTGPAVKAVILSA